MTFIYLMHLILMVKYFILISSYCI